MADRIEKELNDVENPTNTAEIISESDNDSIPQSSTLPDNFDSIVENIVDKSPDVSDHVVYEFEQNMSNNNDIQKDSQPTGITDKSGTIFDKTIHRSDEEGNPIYTKAGNFKKKPGKKAGSDTGGAADPAGYSSLNFGGPTPENLDLTEMNKQNDAFAKIGTSTASQLRIWASDRVLAAFDKEEREYFESALKAVLAETDITVNPWVGFAIAIGTTVALPLATVPPEHNKVLQIGMVVYTKIFGTVDE